MKKLTLTICLLVLAITTSLVAQEFLRPFEAISGKKPTYVTREDGREMEGTVKKIKFKKGLIKEIRVEQGEEVNTVPMEDIDYAYLPQSGWDKFLKVMDVTYDATKWNDEYDSDRLKDGYAYFEKSDVQVKKNKMTLLMQLLNPGTCSRIKVYHDPFAGETASLGVGGIAVTGGDDKSYYIRIDDGTAFKLTKKNYRRMFGELFGDCKKTMKKYEKAKWSEFEEAVFAYNGTCGT